ncbi:hypothetical protein NC997_25580 [Trichocoleus sp. DQ-A2]|jgi:hypothetical protein|uniref:hypothetical protein n=1 Tax=Cyanophyceae TaxID=3028117 RepID=UPI001687B1C6|nr:MULTISPECIES: hypothetical protein [unclassified Coleofasciculus]MBD1836995.1 hypothetical protein [Coleofasciculus sp. FACHB-501]MBD1880540.1 hypothetical protein [Coleofasciculus sp. FACHB-T130]MBD2538375.1 hypothetical protein [Coleofasciculus sp. FACHB-SPT36]MBD1888365.1 hypothetical protein [Coleofasciculus sp. FACHB-SPT9]MBD1900401.1 hypothetical protein [Coleofasciculus sp. FACHB-125]
MNGAWLIKFSVVLYFITAAALLAELINFHPFSGAPVVTSEEQVQPIAVDYQL